MPLDGRREAPPRRPAWYLGACLALLLALASVPAHSDLIINGGFETGPPNPTGDLMLTSPSSAIAGWTVSAGSIEMVSDVIWVPEEGHCSIALNGSGPGALSQTFSTAPGAVYVVGFWMSGEPFSDPVIKHLRVSAAGQSADFSFDSSPVWHWLMGWTQNTWNFTANDVSTTLTFASLDAGPYSPAIDAVTVGLVSASVDAPVGLALSFAPPSPNPSRGPMRFSFTLPRADQVSIRLVDLQGRELGHILDGEFGAGPHDVTWNARARLPGGARPGLYFAELRTSAGRRSRAFVYLP